MVVPEEAVDAREADEGEVALRCVGRRTAQETAAVVTELT